MEFVVGARVCLRADRAFEGAIVEVDGCEAGMYVLVRWDNSSGETFWHQVGEVEVIETC